MPMKVQLKDIVATHRQTGAFIVNESLVKLVQVEPGRGVTKQQAHDLGDIAEAAGKEVDRIEKRRIDLIRLHGDDDGKEGFVIPPERQDAYFTEVNEWLDVEVDLPGDPIRFDALGDDIPLSGLDYIRLRWLIVNDKKAALVETAATAAASGD